MKILVLGSTGMAGHIVSIYLQEAGHDITGFSRREFKYCRNIIGDITNFELLKNIIDKNNYDIVVNAVGILIKESENNKAHSILVNSYLPHYLSAITEQTNTKIIHISTDCVFSGKTGGYSEKSLRDGKHFYDRTKALGEIENKKDLTFRNSIIGPDINENGVGLLNWFMQQKAEIKGFTKAIWTGVTTLTLAKAIESVVKENICGLYNLVNNEVISKYDLLKLLNRHIRNETINIIPDDEVIINKSLINNRSDFSFIVPSYENMIIDMKDWIKNHKEIYPHYYK